MPRFVKDPYGITHNLLPIPDKDYGWQTACGLDVLFSAKWSSCFPYDRKPNCIGCLAQ